MDKAFDAQNLIRQLAQLDTLTNWEAKPRDQMRVDLRPMIELMARLGDPHHAFRSIHVAGTKGKSSVCALVEAALVNGGFRVGRYASPHVHHICERFSVDGVPVSENQLATALERCLEVYRAAKAERTPAGEATWFDILTAAAFLLFRTAGVEWAVVETGLGGRLDSTNVVQSSLQIITNIALEHTEVLGKTRAKIAFEKAGIIKPRSPVLTSLPEADEAGKVIADRAAELGCVVQRPPVPAGGETILDRNKALVRLALDALGAVDARIGSQLLDDATARQTKLPGRLELRTELSSSGTSVPVVLDGAHVPFNLAAVMNDLAQIVPAGPCFAVVALGQDKDARGFFEVLAGRDIQIAFARASDRSWSPEQLEKIAGQLGISSWSSASVSEAYDNAIELAARNDGWVFVTGSLYLIGLVPRHSKGVN